MLLSLVGAHCRSNTTSEEKIFGNLPHREAHKINMEKLSFPTPGRRMLRIHQQHENHDVPVVYFQRDSPN